MSYWPRWSWRGPRGHGHSLHISLRACPSQTRGRAAEPLPSAREPVLAAALPTTIPASVPDTVSVPRRVHLLPQMNPH